MKSDVPMVLLCENLTVSLRRAPDARPILDAIQLRVRRNEIVGLVGESGSGKSTLISAAMGLLPKSLAIDSGEIRVLDKVAADANRPHGALDGHRGGRIALIGQSPMSAFNPVLSIGQQFIDFQWRRPKLSREEKLFLAQEWLARVGIPNPRKLLVAYPHELSGGMLQRVAIAAALMHEPAVLLADEPTTALDATNEDNVLRLLTEARARYGLGILLVSHHLGLISAACDRIVVLYGGAVVEEGAAADVLSRPRHPYTADLIACDPSLSGNLGTRRLPSIPGRAPALYDTPLGCHFAVRCRKKDALCLNTAPTLTSLNSSNAVACHFPEPASLAS